MIILLQIYKKELEQMQKPIFFIIYTIKKQTTAFPTNDKSVIRTVCKERQSPLLFGLVAKYSGKGKH